MTARQDCIRAAVNMGLTEEDAGLLVDDIAAQRKKLAATGQTDAPEKVIARRIMEKAELARRQALAQRRQAALNIVTHDRIQGFVDTVKAEGGDVVDAMEALLVGSSRRFSGSRESASRLGSSLKALWGGSMANELERAGLLPLLKQDRNFSDLVMREMISPESTGDRAARQTADIFSRYLEHMRRQLNEYGADIGKLDGYAPQSHDSLKLRRAGEAEWVRYMAERLDWERTFPDLPDEEVLGALGEVYQNIVTGVRQNHGEKTRGSAFTPPRNLATNLGRERVLHFKDAAGAVEYNRRFGTGNIMQGMIAKLETYARRLALMRTFGPNPEVMIKGFLDREIQAARKAHGDPERILNAWQGERRGKLGHYYRALAGETGTPENISVARVAATIRGLVSMAKLGGAFLSSFADIGIKAAAARHAGEGWLEAWHTGVSMRFERFQSREKRELGRQLGVYTQALLGELYSKFDVNDALPGKMTRWMNAFFKMSGLTDWTEAHRAAYTFHLSSRLAHFVGEGADGVNKDLAVILRRNGLMDRLALLEKMVDEVEGEKYVIPENAYRLTDAELEGYLPERFQAQNDPRLLLAKWKENRRSALADLEREEPFEGVAGDFETGSLAEYHKYLQTRLPEDLRHKPGLPDADAWEHARAAELARMRENLARDVMGYFADETGYAVLEPDAKTRATMYGSTRAGTLAGEMLRFAWQFKSFPVAYWQRIMSESRWQRASADQTHRITGDIPGFIHFFAASTVLGYVSMAAKDISKGREPRSLWENPVEVTLAAIMQGGGLGLLGDFFLGTADRFGNQLASNLIGPAPQALSNIGVMFGQLVRGEFREGGETAARFIVDNLPFVNLWYTRMAMDYMVNYHVREWMSPGTLRRSEKKMWKEFRQKYLTIGGIDLTPSRHIAQGGGFR